MNSQTDELDQHIKTVMAQISEAALKPDLAAIQRLTRKASELQELKEQMAAIQQRIASLISENTNVPVAAADQRMKEGIRQLPIEATDGMIRQTS